MFTLPNNCMNNDNDYYDNCAQQLNETKIGNIDVVVAKARTANNLKRSTKVFEEGVAGGKILLLNRNRMVKLPGQA